MEQNLVADLYERLGSLNAKMDQVLTTNKDLEDRVRVLEDYKAKFLGVIAVVSLIATIGWQAAMDWVFPDKVPTPPSASP